MADAHGWRRRRGVSLVRGVALLLWLAGAALLVTSVFSETPSASAPAAPATGAFGTVFAALVIVPAVWCVPVGAYLDHHLSRFGALALAVIHALGSLAAYVLVMTVVTVLATVRGTNIPQAFALLALFLLPPALTIGFLLAMLVPGSFPRGATRPLEGVGSALRAVAGGLTGVRGSVSPSGQ